MVNSCRAHAVPLSLTLRRGLFTCRPRSPLSCAGGTLLRKFAGTFAAYSLSPSLSPSLLGQNPAVFCLKRLGDLVGRTAERSPAIAMVPRGSRPHGFGTEKPSSTPDATEKPSSTLACHGGAFVRRARRGRRSLGAIALWCGETLVHAAGQKPVSPAPDNVAAPSQPFETKNRGNLSQKALGERKKRSGEVFVLHGIFVRTMRYTFRTHVRA